MVLNVLPVPRALSTADQKLSHHPILRRTNIAVVQTDPLSFLTSRVGSVCGVNPTVVVRILYRQASRRLLLFPHSPFAVTVLGLHS